MRDLNNKSAANITHKCTKQHQFPMQRKKHSEDNLGKEKEITWKLPSDVFGLNDL